ARRGAGGPAPPSRRIVVPPIWLPFAAAAALVLALATVFIFFASDPVPLLAAHLADDHVRCFLAPPGGVDAAEAGANWLRSQGWRIQVASTSRADHLR